MALRQGVASLRIGIVRFGVGPAILPGAAENGGGSCEGACRAARLLHEAGIAVQRDRDARIDLSLHADTAFCDGRNGAL